MSRDPRTSEATLWTSTGTMTTEEIAHARGAGKLVVDANGMGSVPTEWLEMWRKNVGAPRPSEAVPECKAADDFICEWLDCPRHRPETPRAATGQERATYESDEPTPYDASFGRLSDIIDEAFGMQPVMGDAEMLTFLERKLAEQRRESASACTKCDDLQESLDWLRGEVEAYAGEAWSLSEFPKLRKVAEAAREVRYERPRGSPAMFGGALDRLAEALDAVPCASKDQPHASQPAEETEPERVSTDAGRPSDSGESAPISSPSSGETDKQCAKRILAILFGCESPRSTSATNIAVIEEIVREHRTTHPTPTEKRR